MHTITIAFTYPKAEPPKYKFGDRVAVIDQCQPEAWATGKIVGLCLEEYKFSTTSWCYICKLDFPGGFTEEYSVDELVFESELPTLQAKWEADAALEPCLIYSEPGTEMDKGVYHCNHRLSCPIESFLAARLTGLNS